jgi:PadR family transcriptional regulator, regulatory protein PadR
MTTRPDTLQGSLLLLVLTVLARRGPLHGYAITAHIQSLSDALRVEEGSLYPALHRMEEAGWIKARTTSRPRADAGSASKRSGGGRSPAR